MTVSIGVMSDTHGNTALMHHAADCLRDRLGVNLIIHVGDDYADPEELIHAGYEVRRVPGLWCAEYHNTRVPNRMVDLIDGLPVAYAHADQDLRAREHAAAIVLTGHTHVAKIERIGATVYLNPGHLKSLYDRHQAPSFASIRLNADSVDLTIHELDGAPRQTASYARRELAGSDSTPQ